MAKGDITHSRPVYTLSEVDGCEKTRMFHQESCCWARIQQQRLALLIRLLFLNSSSYIKLTACCTQTCVQYFRWKDARLNKTKKKVRCLRRPSTPYNKVARLREARECGPKLEMNELHMLDAVEKANLGAFIIQCINKQQQREPFNDRSISTRLSHLSLNTLFVEDDEALRIPFICRL